MGEGVRIKLDFSGLDALALLSGKTQEEISGQDSLLSMGYTVVAALNSPFNPPLPADMTESKGRAASPLKRQPDPLKTICDLDGMEGSVYRAAMGCLLRHTPPPVDAAYWATHQRGLDIPPPGEMAYWKGVAEDMAATAAQGGQAPLLQALLTATLEELEREYSAAIEAAARGSL